MKIVFKEKRNELDDLFNEVMRAVEENGDGEFPEYVILNDSEWEGVSNYFGSMEVEGVILKLSTRWFIHRGVLFFSQIPFDYAFQGMYEQALKVVERQLEVMGYEL